MPCLEFKECPEIPSAWQRSISSSLSQSRCEGLGTNNLGYLFVDGSPLRFVQGPPLPARGGMVEGIVGVHQAPAGHTGAVAQEERLLIL